MVSLLVILIILGCAAGLYFKGTLVNSFVTIIISICASVVAFGYFELLANLLIDRRILVTWACPLSFLLLFIIAFAALQAIASQLIRQPVNFGPLPERIGRPVCGIFLGLILSGVLLTIAAISPISPKYPYQRFDETALNSENPVGRASGLNADGFATGWFSIISSGSFSGKKSFATFHQAFLDQLFLNRLGVDNEISVITNPEAIEAPSNKAVWPAPEGLKDSDGKPMLPKSGYNLTIVQVEITTRGVNEGGGVFMPAQLRLVCRPEGDAKERPFAGKGKSIYPYGYMKTTDELQKTKLTDRIQVERSDLDVRGVKKIDFAFYVPAGFIPVLVEFKQNCVVGLPPPVSADQAPPIVPFVKPAEPPKDANAPEPNKPAAQPSSPAPHKEPPKTSSPRPAPGSAGKSVLGIDD